MTTAAISAFGITLTRDGNAIAEITNLDGVEKTRRTVEVTAHGASNTYTEYIPTLKDSSEVRIEGNFKAGDTNGQVALDTDLENGTLQTFVLTFPSAITATWTFTAYVTALKAGEFPVDGKLPFSATLRISGKPVLAITASADITTMTGIEENAGAALDFVPNFAGATYGYNVLVNTLSTWIKLTVTDATATITVTAYNAAGTVLSGPSTLTTAVQSGAITIGAADSVTKVVVKVQDSGKVAKEYTINIARP